MICKLSQLTGQQTKLLYFESKMIEVETKQGEDGPSKNLEDYVSNAKAFLLRSDGKSGVTM